ncbi:alpha/beta fold hydrolase [Gordonia sp. JH63]|uniref:Alpha/beta hydrolase n=1 Tax=Gordonia hongkongensis TaxID=1701090 RepID=A0ABT6BUC2_9ACTN|nr:MULTISPECIES: alpha/beta hydrolase [Gordonia]OCW87549.1 alpha/beta hydrolase [Nocardia farcinica]MCX2753286.1 alpha/beta hydrolase [Gordonia sp. 4N]MDF6101652.1 alpha/beta hydrolase [Gordonia hongkongensis]MDT0219682.1 alpha/beta hydrolase [Gordonia sp. AC31]OCH79012.1 alpha/beta hydrolase [Gordonia sp. UCD-TK1]
MTAPSTARVNGIDISYSLAGSGPLVVMVMGTGSPGRVWKAHQEPALVKAGFTVVTFDNRGVAPSSECAEGFTLDDMVADTAALIEHLGRGPAIVIGTSLGARITQELALARPDVVKAAVMVATYGRNTPLQEAISAGERALYDNKIKLPPEYEAAITAHLNLSPHTLDDDRTARDWLDIIGFSPQTITPGVRAQLELHNKESNRLAAYRGITRPALVVGFADDRTLPAKLAREVAEAIPGAEYVEIERAGHFGYLEQPAEVNRVLVEFCERHRA